MVKIVFNCIYFLRTNLMVRGVYVMLKLSAGIVTIFIVLSLSACGGRTRISQNLNSFDNSKTISMMPSRGPYCKFSKCWLVGAEYNTGNSEKIIIKTEIHRKRFGITQLFINIDGEKKYFKAIHLTDIAKDKYSNTIISKNYFTFELKYIQKMISAQNITCRAITTDGYSDFIIKRGNTVGHSYKNLINFLNKINKINQG